MNDDIEVMLKLSYYKEIAVLNEEHNVYLVQHTETSKTYVKKITSLYSRKVYEQIYQQPISGIPKIIDLLEIDGQLVIIEEYISGKTLLELLNEKEILTESEVVSIISALCDILQRLHSFNPPIVHRDIKPSNIMLTEDQRIVLLDFNGAKQQNPRETKDTQLIGTHGFAAPEQYGFGASSIQTDLYSTGILMTVLLTGSITEKDKCPKAFRHVIDKCTRLDSDKRYTSALQLKKAVCAIPRNNKRILLAALSAGIVMAGLVMCVFCIKRRPQRATGTLDTGSAEPSVLQEITASAQGSNTSEPGNNSEPDNASEPGNTSELSNASEPDNASEPGNADINAPGTGIGHGEIITTDTAGVSEAADIFSPAGVYQGNDDELLVIADNGLAYYYCDDLSFTELECPWARTEDTLSISFSKTHCTATANISNGCDELILKSASKNWNSEVFENLHLNPTEYIISPPSKSECIEVQTDGTMCFSIDNILISVPRQYVDFGNDASAASKMYTFVDQNHDEGYFSALLFCEKTNISTDNPDSDYKSIAERFTGSFMDNLQIGYSEPVTIAGRQAYSVTVSGLLNEGFGGITGTIYSGKTVIIPKADNKGMVFFFMVQIIGTRQDNTDLFNKIMRDAVDLRKDMDDNE